VKYVSLHHHSTFSYGDAYGLPSEHAECAHLLGMSALALTEHGNTSSHPKLEQACIKLGIKPIFGCEIYLAPPKENRKCHQTVLAMDLNGYANLNALVSQSWRDFYRWPTVHLEYLEQFNDGLIVLSGCADSTLSCTLLGGKSYGEKRLEYSRTDFDNATRLVEWYQTVFGDRYYIEVQVFPELERACALNPAFEKLSKLTGARLAATHDCHTVFARDAEMRKILHAAHRGSTVDAVAAEWEYGVPSHIPESDETILERLEGTGLSANASMEALVNTSIIADRCNVVLPKVQPITYNPSESDLVPWV
jgi:DNA polymerase-3 subunit alpha